MPTPRIDNGLPAEHGSTAGPRAPVASSAPLAALPRSLSSATLEQVVRSIASILVVVDGDGRVELWNEVAEQVFGVSAYAVLGRRLVDVLSPLAPELEALFERCLAGSASVSSGDLRYESARGSRGLVGLSVTPLREGERRGFLITGREITQKKQLDAQLAHSLKLESIGRLAAGIAHEINTPTQFVNDNLSFLRDAFAELAALLEHCARLGAAQGDQRTACANELADAANAADLAYLSTEIPKAIEESLSGLGRVTRIVGAMKEFSHPSSGEKVAIDLNRAIESTLTVARNEWKYVATIELHLAPDLPAVPCLPDEMNQVVLNMLVNAAHAIAEKNAATPERMGRIAISTAAIGDWVELRIADDGTGIPDAVRERIFDPFFTTKPVGKGTGQGLSIARSVVVDKHQGTIGVESVVGQGTTFVVRLPLAPLASEARGEPCS